MPRKATVDSFASTLARKPRSAEALNYYRYEADRLVKSGDHFQVSNARRIAALSLHKVHMQFLMGIRRQFNLHDFLRIAIFAAILANPICAQADNWSGVPTVILGFILVPAAGIAVFLVALSLATEMHWIRCAVATALFAVVAWNGFRFFAGVSALVSEGPSIPYYGAMLILAVCVGAYCVIVFRYGRWYMRAKARNN